jgi:hypothetical protein
VFLTLDLRLEREPGPQPGAGQIRQLASRVAPGTLSCRDPVTSNTDPALGHVDTGLPLNTALKTDIAAHTSHPPLARDIVWL